MKRNPHQRLPKLVANITGDAVTETTAEVPAGMKTAELAARLTIVEQATAATTDASLTRSFAFVNQATVTIGHMLGRFVDVSCYDSAGNLVEGSVKHLDLNNLQLSFSQPLSGTVVLA